MDKIRHILSLLLIVMTIYVGAGVPIVHYCCDACATVGIEVIETRDCHKVHHHHEKEEACCNHTHDQEEDECQLTIEHINLARNIQNEISELTSYPLVLDNPIAIMASNYMPLLPIEYTTEAYCVPPPLRAHTSRYYLNLYATLTI